MRGACEVRSRRHLALIRGKIIDKEEAPSLSVYQKVRANFRVASPQALHTHDNGAARYETQKAAAV